MLGGIEAAEAEVGLERVGIGSEVEGVAEDDGAFRRRWREARVSGRTGGREACVTGEVEAAGRVECGEELVEIGGGLGSEAEFVGGGAEERGEFFRYRFGEREPRGRGGGPAVDAEGAPLFDDAGKMGFGAAREEAERVAVEVDFPGWEEKFIAEAGEGIGGVERGGIVGGGGHAEEVHAAGEQGAKEKSERRVGDRVIFGELTSRETRGTAENGRAEGLMSRGGDGRVITP